MKISHHECHISVGLLIQVEVIIIELQHVGYLDGRQRTKANEVCAGRSALLCAVHIFYAYALLMRLSNRARIELESQL